METGIEDDKRLDLMIAKTILMLDRAAGDDVFDDNDLAMFADLSADWKALQEDRLSAAGEEMKVGDVVQLKSDGVIMTVEAILNEQVSVVWSPQTMTCEPVHKVLPKPTLNIVELPSANPASPKKEQTPSIGRIVRYRCIDSEHGKYKPAIIVSVGVEDQEVDLYVFDVKGDSPKRTALLLLRVGKGDAKGKWSWPPYVP